MITKIRLNKFSFQTNCNFCFLHRQGSDRRKAEEGRRVQQRQVGPGLGERERTLLERGSHDEGHSARLLAKLPRGHRAQLDESRQDRRPQELRHRVGLDGAEGHGRHGRGREGDVSDHQHGEGYRGERSSGSRNCKSSLRRSSAQRVDRSTCKSGNWSSTFCNW